MPILNDIMDSEVFGPPIRQGRAEGRVEGQVEGRVEGRVEGQIDILPGQIKKRFGSVPQRYSKRLASLTPEELRAAGLRILDAGRIEDLFARSQTPAARPIYPDQSPHIRAGSPR